MSFFSQSDEPRNFEHELVRILAINATYAAEDASRQIKAADRPTLTFTMQLYASSEHYTTKVNLGEIVQQFWSGCHGKEELPKNCYIKHIDILSYTNNSDYGMVIKSITPDITGTHLHRQTTSPNSSMDTSLWYLEPNNSMVLPSGGHRIHDVNCFVNSEQYNKYHPLLRHDIEDAAVHNGDGRYVSYTSHNRYLHTVADAEAGHQPCDVLALMIASNEHAFTKKVYASNFVEPGIPGSSVSFKIAKEDWEQLMESVATGVISPMRLYTQDLTKDPEIGFSILPIVPDYEMRNEDSILGQERTGWQHPVLKGLQNQHVQGTLRVTLAFPM